MNLRYYFEAAVQRFPDALAVVDSSTRWTYEKLAQEVYRLASGLWATGLRPGDRVMVLLRNCRENVVIFWACQYIGLVYVPVSHRFASNDIAYCIEDAEPEVLFCDEASAATLSVVARKTALPAVLYVIGTSSSVGSSSITFRDFEQLSSTPHIAQLLPSQADDSDIAVMLYSSGITGAPKGIPRSHLNEVSATTAHIIQNQYGLRESTLALSAFCHTMGLRMLLAMTMLNGKLVLVSDERAEVLPALLAEEQISCLYAFPGVYHDLLNTAQRQMHGLQKLAYAGDAMSDELIRQCFERFAPDIFVNHYGSTEIYTYTTCSWLARKPSCAGRPGIHTQLRIVTPTPPRQATPDDIVSTGEVGELIIQTGSPEAFRGYWNRPDLTMESIRSGWYFTGDLVRVDDEGDLWVVGRVDDMVISAGEKVFPSEIERVLQSCPQVREVVVLGLPDARAGKLLTAFVVPTDPSVTIQELARFCQASPMLADFKRPARFVLLERLPRQGNKILRKQLLSAV